MKSILIVLSLSIATNSFSWVENEDQFSSYPYYSEMVSKLCLNCGPNESGYRINDIYPTEETQAEVCYIIVYTVTYDDDYGPVNEDLYKEFCFETDQ